MRLLALTTLAGLLAFNPPSAIAQSKSAPVIDMHMHARPGSTLGADGRQIPPPCAPAPCVPVAVVFGQGTMLERTLRQMQKYNVVKGFLGDADKDVDGWVLAEPNRFVRSSGVPQDFSNPALPDLAQLRAAFQSGRLKGFGELGTQYMTIAPNDERLRPYFALAEEFDVPVFIHTTGLGAPVPAFRASLGRPLLLEDVLVRHPKLRLYFENAGYPFLDEAVALMSQYPQVYADLSTITWIIPRPAFYRYLRGLADAGLTSRLMFGSDQMEWPEVIGEGIKAIETAPFLTARQKRDILYNNAARFLRLDADSVRRAQPSR